jgi:hypothetical protein
MILDPGIEGEGIGEGCMAINLETAGLRPIVFRQPRDIEEFQDLILRRIESRGQVEHTPINAPEDERELDLTEGMGILPPPGQALKGPSHFAVCQNDALDARGMLKRTAFPQQLVKIDLHVCFPIIQSRIANRSRLILSPPRSPVFPRSCLYSSRKPCAIRSAYFRSPLVRRIFTKFSWRTVMNT